MRPPRDSRRRSAPARRSVHYQRSTAYRRRTQVSAATDKSAQAAWRPLIGQKALVTGANSGIGRAVALALVAAGADVGVNYVTRSKAADSVVDEIRQSG